MRVLIMAMQMKCVSQINTTQHGKNVSLNERDADFQDIDSHREDKRQPPDQQSTADRHAEQHAEQHMASRHIGK